MSNSIKITACDNQLIVLALQWGESYEICNIKSGNNNAVEVPINIIAGNYSGPVKLNGVNKALEPADVKEPVSLPPGEYVLVYAGINWGGPYQFTLDVNEKKYSLPKDSAGEQFGFVWNDATEQIKITV